MTALGTGDVDLAIIAGEARQHSGPSMSLWSERIVAALSSRHPLFNNEVIDWSDLKDETFLLSQWDPGLDLRNLILKKLAAPGDTPKIETWDTSNEKVLGMVEAGLHVSIHFESWTSLTYTGVRFRELRDTSGPSHITFTACWEEHNRNPALARFLETLRQAHHPTTLT
jgi:DNA-binding transcriptional LysR family regulator